MSFLHHEVYDELPPEILDTDSTTSKKFVAQLLHSTIPVNDYCPVKFGKSILLLNTKAKPRNKKRRNKSLLSRQEKQALKIVEVPKSGWNYDELQPLRDMWRQYFNLQMRSIYIKSNMMEIECSDMSNLHSLLAKADYHGAEFKVMRSKNFSLVGICGTCVVDKKNVLIIVSKDNKCRTIPKADCVFEIDVVNLKLTVFGKYMTIRPAERSVKKLKTIMIPDL